jgi:hypothetical protein
MLYAIFGLKFDIQFEKLCEKCVKTNRKLPCGNVILEKVFNLDAISSFFHVFTHPYVEFPCLTFMFSLYIYPYV